MADIYEPIGGKIRKLRTTLKGKGISSGGVGAGGEDYGDTLSRWETATYKPSVADLEALARFLWRTDNRVLSEAGPRSRAKAPISATADL